MFQVSVSSIHSSSSRSHGLKLSKLEKGRSKLFGQKKSTSNNGTAGTEEKTKSKESFTIKEEPVENVKEELFEDDLHPLEAENTIQHSDILTSLQMIPVVKKNPVAVVKEPIETIDEPIETSKILAAMREAMMDSEDKISSRSVSKPTEKKKKIKTEEKHKRSEVMSDVKKTEIVDGNLIICNGCGMQFDNSSACQRHKKKCVYWKEDKSSENVRNKCSSCGLVFPYLMALLRHSCLKVEVSDEPSMPELCPEQPVEELQYSGADDIPILSPAEVSRDDVQAKKMSFVEAVVREVSCEAFDVSVYHEQWLSSRIEAKTRQRSGKVLTNKAVENPGDKLAKTCAINVDQASKRDDSKTKEEKPTTITNTSLSPKNTVSLSKKPLKKVASPQNKLEDTKNKKVSDIFKEVKRRGRKRQKNKVLPYKPLTKVGFRRTGLVAKKNKTISKKTRSSNFVMLMKEWEKLEKEGAVALGTRKRQSSNTKVELGNVHRSRRATALNINTEKFDTESSAYDSSSPPDSEVETFIRKTRRTNSVETTVDDFPSIDDTNNSKKLVFSGKIKTEKEESNVEIKPSKKKPIIDASKNYIVDEEISVSLVKEERDETNVKRKPGRPKFKNITMKTAEHINETIDSIIHRSLENHTSEHSNDSFTSKTDLLNLSESSLLAEKSKDVKLKVEEHQPNAKVDEVLKWSNVYSTIYDVSIGSAGVYNLETTLSSTNLDINKRGRYRKISFNESSEETTNCIANGAIVTNSGEERDDKCLFEAKRTGESSKCSDFQNQITEKTFKNVTNRAASSTDSLEEKSPSHQNIRGKRKLSFSEEEKSGASLKRKDVKTKQLSIADYLSISKFVNRSSTQGVENNIVEQKPNEKLLNINKTNKIVNDDTEGQVTISSKKCDKINVACLSEVSTVISKDKIDSNTSGNKMKVRRNSELSLDDKPSSPGSVSSKDDVALSVIRDEVIQKRKKKLKMKLLKKKQLQLLDNKTKTTKPKVLDGKRSVRKDKLKKVSKKIKVGVSRNRWEVSVVDNKKHPIEVVCEDDSTQAQNSNNHSTEQTKKFYCAICDQKYESSYALYQHQSTTEHKRNTLLAEQQRNMTDDNDPVKYCKSIGNIINDLEKRTLNVAKVMYQLKQSEPASEATSAPIEPTSSVVKETTDWSRCPTPPTWETQQQAWEVDSFSTGSSLGSIMDTVNKVIQSLVLGLICINYI